RNRYIKNGLMFPRTQRVRSKTTIGKFDMENAIHPCWFYGSFNFEITKKPEKQTEHFYLYANNWATESKKESCSFERHSGIRQYRTAPDGSPF
ncbi:MAG: hypothetical protein LBI05_00845, partial [Planctomycetaceae bacterium]|nr:hypothetical protein [Planctomycetaceae bacterium]